VALFALVSKVLYHDLLYRHAAALTVHPLPLLAAAASTLLVPTFCMGVTLPVLSKVLSQSLGVAASRIAGLYGWNTLGAAMGAWVGTAVLIPLVLFYLLMDWPRLIESAFRTRVSLSWKKGEVIAEQHSTMQPRHATVAFWVANRCTRPAPPLRRPSAVAAPARHPAAALGSAQRQGPRARRKSRCGSPCTSSMRWRRWPR